MRELAKDLDDLHKELSKSEEYRGAYAEEDLLHRVAKRIRQIREACGLTQEQLAKAVATKQPAIADIEAGFRNLTLRTVARIAYALDVDPIKLLDRREVTSYEIRLPWNLQTECASAVSYGDPWSGRLEGVCASVRVSTVAPEAWVAGAKNTQLAEAA